MNSFKDRRDRFEAEFAHDEERRFKIEARRDRLVGHWAAAHLGKTGDDADAYAASVIRADLEEPGDEDVFAKLRADLPPGDISDEDIREAMGDALDKAADEYRGSAS